MPRSPIRSGYKNVSHFNKLFKEEYGCIPKNFKSLYDQPLGRDQDALISWKLFHNDCARLAAAASPTTPAANFI